ncbi:ABC transporter permease [Halosquirtibacter xylanolyticus]|uniref:ABC transporter permease n=1 Tax=Halosquirtibacter xylanolyticus TaxID=3374599 RepID=UPI003749C75A|nr:ABC transporter permease [Prolixibacteraceae bacterium]
MKIILYLIQKEFLQIKRNKAILPIIFAMPIVQMLVLVWATTSELKEVHVDYIDQDHSEMSRKFYNKIDGLDCFYLQSLDASADAIEQLHNHHLDAVVEIPLHFARDLEKGAKVYPQVAINAVNSNNAEMIKGYFENEWQRFLTEEQDQGVSFHRLELSFRYWYNPEMDFKFYMAPGILAILISLVGMMLSGMNFVREKEMGTIEQINVTPIKKYQFISGKLIPFLIIGIVDLLLGLFIARIAFGQPIIGNLGTLILGTAIYLVPLLGISLWISAISDKQQQVMFICFFFLLIFILMSGMFTPVESMPLWAQQLNYLNPQFYYIKIIRGILLKGATIMDISRELICLTCYGVIVFLIATYKYKKVS